MADQHDTTPRLVVALGLAVDFGDQRAGRIDKEQLATAGLGRHRLGHAMRREHHRAVVGHLVELVDEHRAFGLEILDHIAVVHDLMADIDRPAIAFERAFHDLDGAIYTGAEAARAGEQDRERLFRRHHEISFFGMSTRSLAGLRTIA